MHELAHWFDYSRSWLSNSDEFLSIYNAEKNSFHQHIDREPHYISASAEYFAESFAWYLENSEILKKHCPMTYTFFASYI